MRIIAGTHKGRNLKAPKWDGLRPTSDKLRETLFNILQHRIDGARVLDAFAGTGAVALEALSRGAASATCLDNDRRAAGLIAENAALCGEADRCVIIRDVASRAAKREVDEAMRDRLVIVPGSATGPFVFKTLDRLTGEVVRQLPREEVMRLRDDAGYNAGRVVDTRA